MILLSNLNCSLIENKTLNCTQYIGDTLYFEDTLYITYSTYLAINGCREFIPLGINIKDCNRVDTLRVKIGNPIPLCKGLLK